MSPAERLEAEAIGAGCAGQLIGRRVIVLDEVTSTNDVVVQMAPDAAEGLVVFAERQTAGRGQYGRRWESAAGRGLWISMLLRPRIPVAESSRLTDMLAHGIATTIGHAIGIGARIKPPNDVYIGDGKVAGVLVEMRVEASGQYCAIAGMGINVNHAVEDFPPELRNTATSLAIAAGRRVNRGSFAIALLRELERRYAGFPALNS
jgi:BirA family transcriptional regulator, biotin operon repressor / biotin---[acetyl-CoA-carboxylase] ligase